MSSNKHAKELLIQRYGAIDFLEELRIAPIKTKKYTSKGQMKKMRRLTYHHIKEKQFGGKATVENGALLREENHIWFHQQSPETKQQLNNAFQDLKRVIDESKGVPVRFVDDDEMLTLDGLRLELMMIDFDGKGKPKHYSRSEFKRDTQARIQAYERGLDLLDLDDEEERDE